MEEKLMGGLADFIKRFYKQVVIVGVIIFVLSIFGAQSIKVETEVKDLLPESNQKVQSYQEIDEYFSGGGSVIITVEGKDKQEMISCAEAFVREVRKNDKIMNNVRAINFKLNENFVRKWGFLLQKREDLEKTRKSLAELNLLPFITALNDSFEETYMESDDELNTNKQEMEAVNMLKRLDDFFTKLRVYLENPDVMPVEKQAKNLAETFMFGDLYGFNYDNTMLMFTIQPDFDVMDMDKINNMMTEIRKIKNNVEQQFPDVKVGYTGDVAIQADEQQAVSFDMIVPALVALVIILLLFIFTFDQFRFIVFIILSLVLGIIFNYGFVGITFKTINLLTSSMAVLLIGLGVDYGIQFVTNYSTYKKDGYKPEEALKLTYQNAGMGILLAALTTAVAFFVMAGTGSAAFAQFGVMMGTGIIMCLIVMMLILPAILIWFGKKKPKKQRLPKINFNFLSTLGEYTYKYKWATLIIGLVITVSLFAAAVTLNEFEYDMMKLEPQDMHSIIQYKKLMDKYEITPFQSMVVADSIKEARKLTEALEEENLVAEVNSISSFIPEDGEQEKRLEEIEKIRNMPPRFKTYEYTANNMDEFTHQLQRLEWNIIEIGDLSVAGLGEDNKIVKKRNEMIREIFGAEVGKPGKEVFQKLINLIKSNPELYAARLSKLDKYFTREINLIVEDMAQVSRKITIKDLPDTISSGLLSGNGEQNLITIYPVKGIMEDASSMQRFNETLEKISPEITGTTQIAVTWMNEASTASVKSALFILAAVIIFLLITFRNIRYALLASTPLILGLIWMLGIYPILGMKINILNICVIPLVIGMGIDFGIHITHRFKVERDIRTVYRYTGKGVLLSAFTTMIGFGSLGLIGKFPSIASMGSILFWGIASCLTTTLLVLPALFGFITQKIIQLVNDTEKEM